MLLMMIIIIVLLIVIVSLIYILIKDNGIFASLISAGLNLIRREGILSAVRAARLWLHGSIKTCVKCESKSKYTDELVHIAFHPTGGMGDYIISGSVLHEIRQLCSCKISVYCEKMAFGQAIYGGIENVEIVEYSYNIFEGDCSSFDVALEVEHFVHIKNWDKSRIKKLSPQLANKLAYIEDNWDKLYVNIPIQCYRERIQFERCKLLGLDRWTELRMGEAFKIANKKIPITMDVSYCNEIEELPQKYVTINYGCDAMVLGKQQLKLWPKEELEKLVSLIHANCNTVKVIQLGAADAEKINGVDEYVLGKSIELTKWILKDSMLHIDCEGGLVHLATQLETRCAVIFGPTPVWMYGYEQNINIVPDGCAGCMGLHSEWAYECFCEKSSDLCMKSILAESVFEKIKGILK